MSIKGKKPFIEEVISRMEEEEIVAFKGELNSSPALTEVSYGDLGESLIDTVHFNFGKNDYKDGIIVKNDEVCVLFEFYNEQTLSIYNIDLSNYTYKKVNEYCTIAELRSALQVISSGEITPLSLLESLEGSDDISVDLNETNDKVQVRLDQDAKNVLYFKEAQLADVTHEVTDADTIITINKTLFNPSHAYQILLEIEGEGSHYGTSLIVFPYNNSQCFTASNLYMAQNEDNKVIATMDDDGQVNITILGYVMTPESQTTTVHYKKLF